MTAAAPPTTAAPPPFVNMGGRGGTPPPIADAPSRSELRLIEQGLRHDWEFPPNFHRLLPMAMLELLTKREGAGYVYQERTRLGAARVLAILNAQNQKNAPGPPRLHFHEHEHRVRTADERRQAFLARLDPPGE